MPYGGNPSGDPSDAVRLLVGDISTAAASNWLTDSQYDYFISVTPNVYIAAQLAANTLAATFAGPGGSVADWTEKTVGDLTIKRSDSGAVAKEFRDLANKLGRMSAASISPYAGGISASDKSSVEQDADRVRPAFVRRLFDNRNATDLARSASSTEAPQ